MSEITLYPFQESHYKRLEDILINNVSALDTSLMGSGKTIFALKFAQDYDLPICVICPSNVIASWKKHSSLYGVEVIKIISYETLRGNRGKIKHGLLSLSSQGVYSPTNKLLRVVERGVLLIYDEVHKLMNETQQNRAAHCLTNTLRKEGPLSRILALSGSPAIRESNSFPLLKILGFSLSSRLYLYDPVGQEYITKGYGWPEIINKAHLFNASLTKDIVSSAPITTHTAASLSSRLFIEVILPNIRSFSQSPPHNTLFDGKLGLYKFSEECEKELRTAHHNIRVVVDDNGALRGNITTPCQRISLACVPTLVRLTERDIAKRKKVVLFIEYYSTLEVLMRLLSRFSPLVLNGKTKLEEREKNIAKFQEDNLRFPLIIVNPKVGGMGIELDDKTGNYPRRAYIIPTYYFIDMIQAVKRTCRANTRSRAEVRVVECDQFMENTKILTSIIKKSSTLKKVLGRDEVLPGDYQVIYEDEDI